MINPTYPGVYVREESSGARAVAGVATSITAFVGMTQRGKLNKPKRIFSLPQYEREFGPGDNAGEMTPQLQLFFDNGGGEAWVTRIAENSAKAGVTLNDEDGNPSLAFEALEDGVDGNNIRIEVNYNTIQPDSTFNIQIFRRYVRADGSEDIQDIETFSNLSMNPDSRSFAETVINAGSSLVSVQADVSIAPFGESLLVAGLIFPPAAPAANVTSTMAHKFSGSDGTLQISVDGSPPIPVAVTMPTSEAGATSLPVLLSDAIETRLASEGITVTVNVGFRTLAGVAGRVLQIDIPGHSFEISSGTGGNDIVEPLMLAPAYGAIYVDQFAIRRPAPTGYVSRIHSSASTNNLNKILNFADAVKTSVANYTLVDMTALSPHGPVNLAFTGNTGPADRFTDGTRYVVTDPLNDFSLGALINVAEHLGTIATSITNNTNGNWDASVHGYRIVLTPNYTGPAGDFTARLTTAGGVNIAAAGFIFANAATLENVRSYTVGQVGGVGGPGNYQGSSADGSDGNVPSEADYRDAFDVMEKEVDLFNLMVLPRARDVNGPQTDAQRKTAFNVASAFCAKERAFLLVDPPEDWVDSSSVETGVDALRIGLDTRNSAVYWPRLSKSDGTFKDPGGAMAGLMARIDGTRGVWKAAAGVEATIRGVNGVEHMMSDPDNGVINPKAANALRVFPDGVLAWGARTLIGFNDSGNIDDKYIPVRRTMLFIEESLYRGLRFAVFEPNDEPLWAQIRLAAGSFMNTLFRQGAFAGGKASDAYFVICDETTTTPTDINLGIVNVVVAFAPLKPAEFVILTVKQIAGQIQT